MTTIGYPDQHVQNKGAASPIDDGGPVFPPAFPVGSAAIPCLSIREYFAAAALAGILTNSYSRIGQGPDLTGIHVRHAYDYADAMLLARRASRVVQTRQDPDYKAAAERMARADCRRDYGAPAAEGGPFVLTWDAERWRITRDGRTKLILTRGHNEFDSRFEAEAVVALLNRVAVEKLPAGGLVPVAAVRRAVEGVGRYTPCFHSVGGPPVADMAQAGCGEYLRRDAVLAALSEAAGGLAVANEVEETAGGWVSVKDRRPKPHDAVLLVRSYGGMFPKGPASHSDFGEWDGTGWRSMVFHCRCDDVTHWSPIPELPPAPAWGDGTTKEPASAADVDEGGTPLADAPTIEQIAAEFSNTIFWNYLTPWPGDAAKEADCPLDVNLCPPAYREGPFGAAATLVRFETGELSVDVAMFPEQGDDADVDNVTAKADAQFVANLPVYVPALLGEIRRLRARLGPDPLPKGFADNDPDGMG